MHVGCAHMPLSAIAGSRRGLMSGPQLRERRRREAFCAGVRRGCDEPQRPKGSLARAAARPSRRGMQGFAAAEPAGSLTASVFCRRLTCIAQTRTPGPPPIPVAGPRHAPAPALFPTFEYVKLRYSYLGYEQRPGHWGG